MSRATPYLLIGGGILTGAAAWLGVRKSQQTTDAITEALNQPPPLPGIVAHNPTFLARTTGYWPAQAGLSATEQKMEGGSLDRRQRPIITLEQYQSNPVAYPYVTVAGDYTIFPDGQRLSLDAFPGVVFRVCDTGGHFFGAKKVYRIAGYEPLDIAVNSSSTKVPTTTTATIFPGDNLAKKGLKEVATNKFKDQTVAGSGPCFTIPSSIQEGRTSTDREALARAVESELAGRSRKEQLAGAWTIRNRADIFGLSVASLLAPNDAYGPSSSTGGFVSTRKVPTDSSRSVATEVLDAPLSDDPTDGADDFWLPSEQSRMRQLGDVYRAAKASGDDGTAARYARYGGYGTEEDVRQQHAENGQCIVFVIGSVECLKGRNG